MFGQSVTLTATVSVTAPGAGSPTGAVTFKDNGVNIATCAAQTIVANVATCMTSTLSVASHAITAVYNGDNNFNASPTSNTVIQAVNACTAAPVIGSVGPTFLASDPQPSSDTNLHVGGFVTLQVPSITPGSCGTATSSTYSYNWSLLSKPNGSSATLSSNTAASPVFVADVQGSYQLSVAVQDGLGNTSATRFLSVTTSACGAQAPTVIVNPSVVFLPNFAPVTITATASSPDNQNDPTRAFYCPSRFAKSFTYKWQVTSSPFGGNFSLNGATTSRATFSPASQGNYSLQLLVTDSAGLSAPAINIPVTVAACTAAPVMAAPTYTSPAGINAVTYRGDTITVQVPSITPGACGTSTSASSVPSST